MAGTLSSLESFFKAVIRAIPGHIFCFIMVAKILSNSSLSNL